HTSTSASLVLGTFDGVLAPFLEKIRGRIAVSTLARRWQMEALGSDAVEIPNGVDVSAFSGADGAGERSTAPTVAFLGRYDERRKGMDVLVDALPTVLEKVPGLRLRIMGDGDESALRARLPAGARAEFLGRVDDARKAAVLAGADVYCAPNLGGESFGIVLVEAMAAGTAVVASDLDAFRRGLADGHCGELAAVGDPEALARALVTVLSDDERRAALRARGSEAVREHDWPVVADRANRVYETIRGPGEALRVRWRRPHRRRPRGRGTRRRRTAPRVPQRPSTRSTAHPHRPRPHRPGGGARQTPCGRRRRDTRTDRDRSADRAGRLRGPGRRQAPSGRPGHRGRPRARPRPVTAGRTGRRRVRAGRAGGERPRAAPGDGRPGVTAGRSGR